MKLWMAALLAVGILAGGMLAGRPPAAMAASHAMKIVHAKQVVYVCTACGIGADHATACPRCHKAMARVATYACMRDGISSDASGPCPTCHEPMKYLPALYRHCNTCSFYYLKSKKTCPVCAKRHKSHRR